ncbi:putative PTS IIA-like nitrogen-regulatory protein PtsN [Candidatus Moduliflexus flocculans]|uniref:Putative PTS IIA-like nitrogen-regulatory protein PtsN n=1 Tax=Candidatus Moduliflexus flocculans TaxID=1499966 RepID=A0A081BQF5_9BACT|nr:putative PTS IIA-like nitrogen-regulatory protein PtsN [Candidatus Moduliflexus flocculans]
MEHLGSIHIQLLSFGLLILVAHFMGKLTASLNLGELVGQLVGGILVNPYLLKVVHISGDEYTLAFRNFYFFTFVFLSIVAFSLGEELHLQKLKGFGWRGVMLCLAQIVTTFIFVAGGFLLVGYDLFAALILGSIGLATSHAATYVVSSKLRLEGEIQHVLANMIVLDDLIEVIVFSLVVQFAIGTQKGRDIPFSEAAFHAFNEVGLALLIGLLAFLLIKFIIRDVRVNSEQTEQSNDAKFDLLWNVFNERPSKSLAVMFVVVGLMSVGVSIAMRFHLPFILVPVVTGMCISNFHTAELFKSLKHEEISPFFNLMFFALIGANIRIDAIRGDTIGYVALYIATRSIGKLVGTRLGAKLTTQDRKIQSCLPKLMLPQAGVAAVEATYVAIVLKNGEAVLNVILPALIFFEIVGLILSEKTLMQWKSWTIGEEEFLQRPSAAAPLPVAKRAALRLSDIFTTDVMKIPLQSATKEGVILELLEVLQRAGKISNISAVFQDVMERERLMSTGIGDGIAIPHGKTRGAKEVVCAFGQKPEGADFQSLDGQPAFLFFLIVSPEDDAQSHLKFLSTISGMLQHGTTRAALRKCSSPQDVVGVLTLADTENKPAGTS